MFFLRNLRHRLVTAATEAKWRLPGMAQLAAFTGAYYVAFRGLVGMLGIAGSMQLVCGIAFGVGYALCALAVLVTIEIAKRENSLVRRAGRVLRKRSAQVLNYGLGAWRTVANTKRELIDLAVAMRRVLFGLVQWAFSCVVCGLLFMFGVMTLHNAGLTEVPQLSLLEWAGISLLILLFGEEVSSRTEAIRKQVLAAIFAPIGVYLRRLKIEWLRQRAYASAYRGRLR